MALPTTAPPATTRFARILAACREMINKSSSEARKGGKGAHGRTARWRETKSVEKEPQHRRTYHMAMRFRPPSSSFSVTAAAGGGEGTPRGWARPSEQGPPLPPGTRTASDHEGGGTPAAAAAAAAAATGSLWFVFRAVAAASLARSCSAAWFWCWGRFAAAVPTVRPRQLLGLIILCDTKDERFCFGPSTE
jgi:hypothetical protein